MPYCANCGQKVSSRHKYCPKCGTVIEIGKPIPVKKLEMKTKYLIIAFVVLVAVVGIILFASKPTGYVSSPQGETPTGQVSPTQTIFQKQSCPYECCVNDERYENRLCQGNYDCINNRCEKRACPFECCPEGDYKAKACPVDYACQNNVCIPLDDDNDGLTNIEEKQIGTNPNLYDSDADTLNDYQEVKIKFTNPLDANTDDDRYNDNIDLNPTIKDSASIQVTILDKKFNINWITLGLAIIGGAVVLPDSVIASPSVTLSISNTGTDYSSYLNYDVVFYVAGSELTRIPQTKGKIEKNSQSSTTSTYDIKAKDVPSILLNAITNQNLNWTVTIENLQYEKF